VGKSRIATFGGFAGGAIFLILNIAAKGEVPGGFKGGVAGFVLGYAVALIVSSLIHRKRIVTKGAAR
jgi:hypothetical protein